MKYIYFTIVISVLAVLVSAGDFSELRQRIAKLQADIKHVQLEQAELAKAIDGLPEVRNVSSIGFFAIKTSTQNMTEGDIVTWDGLDTNLGDGFSLLTNSFVCPVGGFYVFQFNLFNEGANDQQTCSATLVLDGSNQVRGHSRIGGQQTIFLTVSQSAFIACEAGQRITLQSDFLDNFVGGQGRTSSFNGFLVYE